MKNEEGRMLRLLLLFGGDGDEEWGCYRQFGTEGDGVNGDGRLRVFPSDFVEMKVQW